MNIFFLSWILAALFLPLAFSADSNPSAAASRTILEALLGPTEILLRGEEARTKIHQRVRSLPEDAGSLFYYYNEGIDFNMYISFSCSKADYQAVVDDLVQSYDVKPRAAWLPEDLSRLGAPPSSLLRSDDWRPSDVKNGIIYEADTVILFIGPDQGRIFLKRWST